MASGRFRTSRAHGATDTKIVPDQRLVREAGFHYLRRSISERAEGFSMSLMLVSVAFLSFSAFQAEPSANGSGAGLASDNRAAPQGTNNTEGTEANGERRICRRITATRTHRYQRVCMTAEQWRNFDQQG
jgi:Tfp pilus assembly protein PilV